MSIHPDNPLIMYAGSQDNGTLRYSGNQMWEEAVGGDGGSTAIDSAMPGTWYGSFQGPQIYKLSTRRRSTRFRVRSSALRRS
jgi:hypothetical protein